MVTNLAWLVDALEIAVGGVRKLPLAGMLALQAHCRRNKFIPLASGGPEGGAATFTPSRPKRPGESLQVWSSALMTAWGVGRLMNPGSHLTPEGELSCQCTVAGSSSQFL